MTLHNLVSEITQFLSWLYYRREWATWELILIAVVALAILIILIGHRKAKARRAKAVSETARSPMTEESASTDSSRNSWITWIIIATASAWVVGLACGVLLTRPGKEKAKVAVVGAEADVDKGRFRKSQSKTRPADPRIKEYQLNLSVRKTESREIKISIDTDFPNGTNLHVWVRRTYYEKGNPEKYSGIQQGRSCTRR
jgi:uncharacterized membrane-anchored protein YhcB (DUF1043 family)